MPPWCCRTSNPRRIDICASCGCRRPYDAHQDARHITLPDLQNAALAAAIPLDLARANIQQATQQADLTAAFLAQVSRPRLVCDIDGTLAERDVATCLVLNAKFGTDYHYQDITSPKADDWIDDPKVAKWWHRYHHDPAFLSNLTPYQDAIWALSSLRSGGYHVTVASDREASLLQTSTDWLALWGVQYDDIHIGDGEKLRIAREADDSNPVCFFDDNPARAADLPGPGVTVFLLDRPWNQSVPSSPQVIRCRTWEDVLSHLPAQASELRKSVAKVADPAAAGIVVRALNSGRVLLVQRAFDDPHNAAGKWEFPGGTLQAGEDPWIGAQREWQEEVGLPLPEGSLQGSWRADVYQGFVYEIAAEFSPDRRAMDDGELENLAWFTPDQLDDMPDLRGKVRDNTDWALVRG